MSMRLRSATRRPSTVQDVAETSQDMPDQKRKRARPSTDDLHANNTPSTNVRSRPTKRRGNAGRLERIHNIPTEIFLEICSYLSPLDVLHMSRTSRSWRDILTSRTSTMIWRAARSTIPGLPDCPEDISEAHYAKLLFERDCHTCSAVNGPIPDFALRLRMCKSCRTSLIFPARSFGRNFPGEEPTILKIVPFTHIGAHTHNRETTTLYYYKRHVEDTILEERERRKTLSKAAYKEWWAQQESRVEMLQDSVPALQAWYKGWTLTNAVEKSEIRLERVAAIKKRLLDLGYEEQDINWGHNPPSSVMSDKPLSERSWNLIRAGLEAHVVARRDARLEQAKRVMQKERQTELTPLYNTIRSKAVSHTPASKDELLYFTAPDFYHLPSVLPLWEDRTTPITHNDFPDVTIVTQELRARLAEIRYSLQLLLLQSSRDTPTAQANTKDVEKSKTVDDGPLGDGEVLDAETGEYQELPDLFRATSLFACTACREPLVWPRLIGHQHAPFGGWPSSDCATNRFTTSNICVIPSHAAIMKRILADFNLPEDAALGEVSREIWCSICKRYCGPWNNALQHAYSRHLPVTETRERRDAMREFAPELPPSGLQRVFYDKRAANKPAPSTSTSNTSAPIKMIKCKLCPRTSSARLFCDDGIRSHLAAKHRIPAAEMEEHIIRPVAS